MKRFLKISTILFIVILLVTTATIVKFFVDANITEQESDDDILSWGPETTVILWLIIVTPCYIAECIVYKEIRYFVTQKDKIKLVMFLRLISLLLAAIVLPGYFLGFLSVWKIPFSIESAVVSRTILTFTAYGILIGIPANLILLYVIKCIED